MFPDTKYWIFSKPLKVKGRKFAVESDWARKNSQKIENLGFLKKNRWDLLMFFETARGRKNAVESDWDSKISQKNWVVKNRWVSWHKILKSFKTA